MPRRLSKRNDSPPTHDISSRIHPITSLTPAISMLVYGRSGTGKTAFASTFPKPILLLDIRERGTDTIAKIDGIDRLQVDQWSDIEEIYWYLVNAESKYKAVVVDQISQLQEVVMEKVRVEDNMEATDAITRRQWGNISGLLKTWLFNYRDLADRGIHILFVAHDRVSTQDDATDEQIDPSVGPRLMPSVASAINGAVNIIGNTFIRETFDDNQNRVVQYCMRLGPHPYYTTKIRQPLGATAPELLVNPSFEKIAALTRGDETPKRLTKRTA